MLGHVALQRMGVKADEFAKDKRIHAQMPENS
jgi:hypothetical protein